MVKRLKPEEEKLTLQDFIELAQARSNTYKFLAALYSYEALGEIAKSIKNKSILSGLSSSGKSFKLMKKFVNEAPKYENLLEELQVAHTALFVMGKFTKGRPYESFYLDPEKKIGARVTINVEKFYKDVGAEFTEARDELADYIGIELEFMHHLCNKEAKAWEKSNKEHAVGYLRIEKTFLREHLGKWAGLFCDDFLEEAKLDFFKAVALITKEFIQMEKSEIDDLLEDAEELEI